MVPVVLRILKICKVLGLEGGGHKSIKLVTGTRKKINHIKEVSAALLVPLCVIP